MLSLDYAYNVGYRHASQHPGPLDVAHSSQIPVIADQPELRGFGSRTATARITAGRGQNVLFGDGSVRWFRTRHVSPDDPDLYLNNDHQPQPGLRQDDSVLVPSHTPFRGW